MRDRASLARVPSWYHAGLLRAASASNRAAILLVFGASACSRAPLGPPVGVSDVVPEQAPPATKHEARSRSWPHFERARSWPEAAPALTALGHRRDGTLLRVRVVPAALDAYRALATDAPMPDGARVAAFHETRGGELLGAYILEKKAGVWGAVELDALGAEVPSDERACLRCHDLAPTDHLFGVTTRVRAASPAPGAVPPVAADDTGN